MNKALIRYRCRYLHIQSPLQIPWGHIHEFNQPRIKNIWKKKISESSRSKTWFCLTLATIYTAATLHLQYLFNDDLNYMGRYAEVICKWYIILYERLKHPWVLVYVCTKYIWGTHAYIYIYIFFPPEMEGTHSFSEYTWNIYKNRLWFRPHRKSKFRLSDVSSMVA